MMLRDGMLGSDLRKKMKEMQITTQQLADTLGVSRQSVSSYLNGRHLPGREMMPRIQSLLGKNLNLDGERAALLAIRATHEEDIMDFKSMPITTQVLLPPDKVKHVNKDCQGFIELEVTTHGEEDKYIRENSRGIRYVVYNFVGSTNQGQLSFPFPVALPQNFQPAGVEDTWVGRSTLDFWAPLVKWAKKPQPVTLLDLTVVDVKGRIEMYIKPDTGSQRLNFRLSSPDPELLPMHYAAPSPSWQQYDRMPDENLPF